ncbi:GDSL esterase/lipase ACHE-like [Hordeum vulgare subsp. vulgare]|nr:GDSL esterase/lipase ACHE-like [Hordeum vulgare subsp. vulgare]
MSLLRLQYYCVLGAVAGAVLFATLRYMPAAGSSVALSTTSALATAAASAGAGEHRKSKGMAQAPTKAAAKVATKRKEVVVFNFGDSNSDTGGVAAIMGIRIAPSEGRAFFHHPTGMLSDGRVVLDPHCAVVLHLARLFA